MKFFMKAPTTEEGQKFYTRYASLTPKLKTPGYLSQVVSGLTEWGILYALIYSSLAVFWPTYASAAGIVGASVGVAIIEGGLRGLLPFSARAIIFARWKGLDGWISCIVIALTTLLLAGSGFLSFAGSRTLVGAIAAPPEATTTAAQDSTATAESAALTAAYEADAGAIKTAYDVRQDAVKLAAGATLRRLEAEAQAVYTRQKNTNQRYPTELASIRGRTADATADRDTELAKLATDREAELAALRTAYRANLAAVTGERDSTRQAVAQANTAALSEHNGKVAAYGGGLAWFTVLCLIILIVSIAIEELHRAGAGIEESAEPDAYAFEGSAVSALRGALLERWRRALFGLVHHIERGTPEAPEPVAAPTIWQRSAALKVAKAEGGVTRKVKPLRAMEGTTDAPTEAPRRLMGFNREPENTNTNTPTNAQGEATSFHCTPGEHGNTNTPAPNLDARDTKQRLRMYKKRLASQTQKSIVQIRNEGAVKPRTAEAIANNRAWVEHYTNQLQNLTKGQK